MNELDRVREKLDNFGKHSRENRNFTRDRINMVRETLKRFPEITDAEIARRVDLSRERVGQIKRAMK